MRLYIKPMIYGLIAALLLKPYIAACIWLWLLIGGVK